VATGRRRRRSSRRASGFVGIYADDVWFGDDAYPRAALAGQHDAGVELTRQPFAWADFARDRGRFDEFVGVAAKSASFRCWSGRVGVDAKAGVNPPAEPEPFAGWAALMVQRYGRTGSFWKDHPDAPKLPITSWQVWNEPNIKAW
jgi:hypothetical protein